MKPEGRRTSFEPDPKAGKEITKQTKFLITNRESTGYSRFPRRDGQSAQQDLTSGPTEVRRDPDLRAAGPGRATGTTTNYRRQRTTGAVEQLSNQTTKQSQFLITPLNPVTSKRGCWPAFLTTWRGEVRERPLSTRRVPLGAS